MHRRGSVHVMTGDELDALSALADWIRAGEPQRGKFFDALVSTARLMVETIDREETEAAAEQRAERIAAE